MKAVKHPLVLRGQWVLCAGIFDLEVLPMGMIQNFRDLLWSWLREARP